MSEACSVCGLPLVMPRGPANAPYAICAEFPGEEEVKQGKVLVGTTSNILRNLLAKRGLSMETFRLVNLWYHAEGGEECYSLSFQACLRELHTRRAVLLLGSACSDAFLNIGVTKVAGLKMTSSYLPKVKLIVPAPNPAQLMHSPPGEVEHSIGRFAEYLAELESKPRKRHK